MNKKENPAIDKNNIRRIFVAAFCVLIVAVVATVMFFMYDPNQNALRALSSVCMDIVCIVILIILVGSFAFDNYGLYKTTRLFAGLLIATIWALFLDFLNWAFDGSLEFGNLTFWFTVCSLCMGSILACAFSLYLYSYMDETHSLSKMRNSAYVCAILNLISFVMTFVLALSGKAFKFVDGHYETGALYSVVEVIPFLTLLYLVGFVIFCKKIVGGHDVFAATGYVLFMLAGAAIESTFSIGTTYVAVAIADIFIFVMLQNKIIETEKHNVEKWIEKSNTDVLTGLLNRHAYENDMRAYEDDVISNDFVYVSVDVNSLKAVNDSYGHGAGDELLIGAGKCLDRCLSPYGKLYRIGGDEFVALIFASEEQLRIIKRDVEESTGKWSGNLVKSLSVSCGYASIREDSSHSVRKLSVIADKRMYEEKAKYYRNKGVDRRVYSILDSNN